MNRSLRIALISLLSLALPVALFAHGQKESATSASSTNANQHITLHYMSLQPHFAGLNKTIDSMFEKTHPNITVKFLASPQGSSDTYHNKLVTMLAAKGSSIDVFAADVIWPPEMASAGWILPIDKWFPKSVQKDYIPAMINADTYQGHIYAVPWLNDIGHLFYRTDLLKGAGLTPPNTWYQLVSESQKLMAQHPGLIGYVADFQSGQQLICNYTEYLWSNNGQFFGPNGKIEFTNQKSVQAVQFMSDLVHKYKIVQPGILSMNLDVGRAIFTDGKAAFHRNWDYVYALAESSPQSKIKGKVATTVVPEFPGGHHASTLGGWSFMVNHFSKNPAAAAELAVFLGGKQAELYRALHGSVVPAISSLLSNPQIDAKYPVYLPWQKEANKAQSRPKSPFYIQISTIFEQDLQKAFLKQETPQQALDQAAQQIKQLMGS